MDKKVIHVPVIDPELAARLRAVAVAAKQMEAAFSAGIENMLAAMRHPKLYRAPDGRIRIGPEDV